MISLGTGHLSLYTWHTPVTHVTIIWAGLCGKLSPFLSCAMVSCLFLWERLCFLDEESIYISQLPSCLNCLIVVNYWLRCLKMSFTLITKFSISIEVILLFLSLFFQEESNCSPPVTFFLILLMLFFYRTTGGHSVYHDICLQVSHVSHLPLEDVWKVQETLIKVK